MFQERIFIYPKDVMIITGKSLRTAKEIIKRIKARYGKARYQPVTRAEFEEFMGIARG